MRPTRWFAATLLMIAGTAAAGMSLNMGLDIYGRYRDVAGRPLVAFGDERVSKYLLSERYVPANFNALLMGSSVSANWDFSAGRAAGMRIYNESLSAGNSVEEEALLAQALERPGIGMVFFVVHPYLTRSHVFETVRMDQSLEFSALGSTTLLDAYKEMVRVELHRAAPVFDAAGTETFVTVRQDLNPVLEALLRPGDDFDVDPIALAAYRRAVERVRAQGLAVVFVVPPMFEDLLQRKPQAFARYNRLITALDPAAPVIDFTAPEFLTFRKTRANFEDGVHLVPPAAREIGGRICAIATEWISQGRLRPLAARQ